MVDGTAVSGSPDEMNCNTAICAVASCIATRSGLRFKYDAPRTISCPSGSSRWPYTTFSLKVNGRFSRLLTMDSLWRERERRESEPVARKRARRVE